MGMGAFAVIFDEGGRVLLAHRRDHDLWNLPGGGVAPGETPWGAVIREAREETGLTAAVARLAIVDHRPERDEVVLTFTCTAQDGAFVPNDEADRMGYFSPDALPANLPPSHRERVADVVEGMRAGRGAALLRVRRGPTTPQWLGLAPDTAAIAPAPRFKLGAFATILTADGVLLGRRRDADFWGQPGGGVAPGEAPWEAAAREAREETGLEVAVERLVGVYCWPAGGEVIFSFACAIAGGRLATSDETSEVRAFAPERLPPNTFAEHRERIADALAHAGPALLRLPTCLAAPEEIRRWRAARPS